MITINEKKIKEKLFGRVKKIKSTGGYKVKKNDLLLPFGKNDSVIYCFCEGCGSLFEIHEKIFNKLTGQKYDLPLLKTKYLAVKSCEACDGADNSILLQDI